MRHLADPRTVPELLLSRGIAVVAPKRQLLQAAGREGDLRQARHDGKVLVRYVRGAVQRMFLQARAESRSARPLRRHLDVGAEPVGSDAAVVGCCDNVAVRKLSL